MELRGRVLDRVPARRVSADVLLESFDLTRRCLHGRILLDVDVDR